MNKFDLRLYILMRNDLESLVPGRAAAQASHATNLFMANHGKYDSVKKWQSQTSQGFGTCIVLAANKETIGQLIGHKDDFYKDWVIDPEYNIRVNREIAELLKSATNGCSPFYTPYYIKDDPSDEKGVVVSRKEYTCAYIFGDKIELEPLLKDLPLY